MPPILRVALQKCEQLLSFLLVSFESRPTHKPVTEMSSCAHQSTEQQHHAVRSFARPTGAVRTGARHHFGRGSKPASQPKPTHSVRPQNTTCTSAAPSAAALTLPASGGCHFCVTENHMTTLWNPRKPLNQPPHFGLVGSVRAADSKPHDSAERAAINAAYDAQAERRKRSTT